MIAWIEAGRGKRCVFTGPKAFRYAASVGAPLPGYFEGDDFIFAGKVGTGFDTKQLLALRARLDRIETAENPFTKGTGLPRKGAHWVRPEVVAQVSFIEWTVHGKLRQPRFMAIREGKAPRDVVRETA